MIVDDVNANDWVNKADEKKNKQTTRSKYSAKL